MSLLRKAVHTLGGLMFLGLFGVFLIQITARFGFNQPLPWTDELAVVLYLWVILWAAAFMVPEREHVVFDLVWNSVGQRTRRWMKIAGHLLIGGLAALAIPANWDYVHFMGREGTPVLDLSFEWVFLPLLLLLLALVGHSLRGILRTCKGLDLEDQEHTT